MSNLGAAKRLRKELQNLERAAAAGDPDDKDVYLRPTSAASILRWSALIRGPPDTPYEGGIFRVSIKCTPDYPLAPPSIAFQTKVCHSKRNDRVDFFKIFSIVPHSLLLTISIVSYHQ